MHGQTFQLEELAADLWKDVQLRALPPDEAAVVWLSLVKVQDALLSQYNSPKQGRVSTVIG